MKRILLFLFPVLLLTACGGNDLPSPTPSREKQENKNANTVSTLYSSRMEIPHLKGGASQFLVKTVPEFGVNYCAEFDCNLRATRWIAYRWDIDNTVDNNVGRTEDWAEDTQIAAEYRVTLEQHRSNGYDRGHMLASEDRQNSKEANRQTFLMTNMHPQFHDFNGTNRGKEFVWYNLENRVRKFYQGWTRKANAQDTIYAVKGGTIDHQDQILEVTPKGLIVPRYFFMAFLYKNTQASQGGYKALAFWVEHTNGTDTTTGNALAKYIISIDELERLTGIDFFCNLPDEIEDVVEANAVPAAWGF